jgi:hypothetical protein
MAKVINNVSTLVKAKQDEIEKQTGKRPSQSDLATYIGVAPTTLSAYVSKKRSQVDFGTWQAMVDYFGVSGEKIFNVVPDDKDEM